MPEHKIAGVNAPPAWYSYLHWRNWPPILREPLAVERHTIAIRDLPSYLQGCTIAQLSDFHADGIRLDRRLLSRAIAQVNEIQPDLIALTGDFVTHAPEPIYELAAQLQYLHSRYGCVAVLGNHDNYVPGAAATVRQALAAVGIQVLWNAIAYPLGAAFPVVGLADMWSGEFQPHELMAQLDPQVPRLVLSHNPDSATALRRWRVDLQLSGHTHGGQIVFPDGEALLQKLLQLRKQVPGAIAQHLWPDCTKVVHHWEWSRGHHFVGQNQLYVNRGLGSYFPGRWRCPPEISVLQLVVK